MQLLSLRWSWVAWLGISRHFERWFLLGFGCEAWVETILYFVWCSIFGRHSWRPLRQLLLLISFGWLELSGLENLYLQSWFLWRELSELEVNIRARQVITWEANLDHAVLLLFSLRHLTEQLSYLDLVQVLHVVVREDRVDHHLLVLRSGIPADKTATMVAVSNRVFVSVEVLQLLKPLLQNIPGPV